MTVYGEQATIMSFIRSTTKLDYAKILQTLFSSHKAVLRPPSPHTQWFIRNLKSIDDNDLHHPLSNVAHRCIAKSSAHLTFHLSWISRVKQREGPAYTVYKIRQYAKVSRNLALECHHFSRLPTGTGDNTVVVVVNGISLFNMPIMWFPTQSKFSGGVWLPASYSVDVSSHQGDMGHTSLEGFIDRRPSSQIFIVTVVLSVWRLWNSFYKLRLDILLF
jgi:hypothetical protein